MTSPSLPSLLSLPTPTRTKILQEALQTHPTLIPTRHQSLYQNRYETLPSFLQSHPHLTKPQLFQLVDWKLTNGKFRPTLRALVDSNSADKVSETTKRAFEELGAGGGDAVRAAVGILTELRGVGPATASLVLSVRDPEEVVFFGDEVAGWVLGDWRREWKYSVKEYLELQERVGEVKGVLGLSAVEVEKVGYVFGKSVKDEGEGKVEGVGKRKMVDEGEGKNGGEEGTREVKGKKKAKVDVSPPPTGTRRSTRSTQKIE